MVTGTRPRWSSVERWSPILFLVGGSLMVGHAALLGVQAFSSLTTPPDLFGPAGHLVGVAGLLGLYSMLADRMPTLTRVAGTVAAAALASWAVMTLTRVLAMAGIVSSVSGVLPGPLFVLAFGSTILTYLLFGAATVRVDHSPRVVGLLVLAPAALLVVVLVDSAITGVSAFEGLLVSGGLALSMLALGHTLRTWDRPTDRELPAGEVTVG